MRDNTQIRISLPTEDLIDEEYLGAVAIADGRIPVYRVHGDVMGVGGRSVAEQLEGVLGCPDRFAPG